MQSKALFQTGFASQTCWMNRETPPGAPNWMVVKKTVRKYESNWNHRAKTRNGDFETCDAKNGNWDVLGQNWVL